MFIKQIGVLLTIILFAACISPENKKRKINMDTQESQKTKQTPLIDYANFQKYKAANEILMRDVSSSNRVVFMGNSITEGWPNINPEYFSQNPNYICRGISGQTTTQMLMRFKKDVIELKPKTVVILAGINDIAQNTGYISLEQIAENIQMMSEMAAYNNIDVILCAVLPAFDFPWNPGLEPVNKVIRLNGMIKTYAETQDFTFVDYHSEMKDEKNGLRVPEFTTSNDLVHPNKAGYIVMEKLLEPAIQNALANSN